ncbi:hypothetical protein G3151_004455 [Salmonella enterica subsp. enterica serovar Montevideo]|nr:hypothetical protein [Salmonella enterica subsp. enterica serovar Montevideo]
MKLVIYVSLLTISCYIFFYNGVLAFIGAIASFFYFCLTLCAKSRFSYLTFPVLVLSALLTIIPFGYKLKWFGLISSVDIYSTAVDDSAQTMFRSCEPLRSTDYDRFDKTQKDTINYCGVQRLSDISYISTGFLGAISSTLYTEFSLASALIVTPARNNKCLMLIDQFLKMCPERKRYYSSENLQMLRDFERKQ